MFTFLFNILAAVGGYVSSDLACVAEMDGRAQADLAAAEWAGALRYGVWFVFTNETVNGQPAWACEAGSSYDADDMVERLIDTRIDASFI